MSGFFALRRATFELGKDFNPVGYKIGLELIVKCGCERVVELPIHFEDRRFGESKLTLHQQMLTFVDPICRLLTDGLHILALFAIGAATVWGAAAAFYAMVQKGNATIEDLLLRCIYLEIGSMVGM